MENSQSASGPLPADILLRLLHQAHGGKVAVLASLLGISPAYATMMLKGQRRISAKQQVQIHKLMKEAPAGHALLTLRTRLEHRLGRSKPGRVEGLGRGL